MSGRLDELERLAQAATPGPWFTVEDIAPGFLKRDAEFIAAADPVTVAALIRAVRAALARDDARAAASVYPFGQSSPASFRLQNAEHAYAAAVAPWRGADTGGNV